MARFQFYDLHMSNFYWQELRVGEEEFFLFSAYLGMSKE